MPAASHSPAHPVTPSPTHPVTDTSPLALLSTEGSTRSSEFFRTVARLGIQAAEALEHAHQMGVVHRDIKPSNLMVEFPLPSPARGRGPEFPLPSPSGRGAESHLPSPFGRGAGGEGRGAEAPRLWITDFGLARIHTPSPLRGDGRGEGASLTMTGDVLGTLRYMSPEQLQAKHGVLDHRTDIYSLGLTLYELLTLQPAFPGDDRQNLIRQIAEDDPRPPRQLNRCIPKDLETIILKATAKEPQSRYATAQQLADDLRRFLEDEPIRARRPTLLQRAAKWSRRHRPLVWSAVALLVMTTMGLAAATVTISRERRRSEENLQIAAEAVGEIYLQFVEDQSLRLASVQDVLIRSTPAEAKSIPPETEKFLRKAMVFYERFAQANRDRPSVRRQTAEAYYRLGRIRTDLAMYPEAEMALRKAVEIGEELCAEYPDVPSYRSCLAAAYFYRGRSFAALRDRGAAIEAASNYDRAIELEPNLYEAHNNLGVLNVAHAIYHNAIAQFTQAIQASPRSPLPYANRGFTYYQMGKPSQAIVDCTKAIQLDPDSTLAYYTLGRVRREQGDLDGAIADYSKALKCDPICISCYIHRGVAYTDHGELEEAFADFEAAIRLAPEEPYAYVARGRAYRQKGEVEKAVADYSKAIKDYEEAYSVRRCWFDDYFDACLNLSETYRASGEINEAIAVWTKLLGHEPQALAAYFQRAILYKEAEDLDQAFTDLVASVDRRGGTTYQQWWMLAKAIKTAPRDTAMDWFFLAMANWRLRNYQEARKCYGKAEERVEQNAPQDPQVSRFHRKAAELLGATETVASEETY